MSQIDPQDVLCPSARMKEGALLVGIVLPDGQVAFSIDRLIVSQDFLVNARRGRSPEKRFRFGDVCVKAGCRQWTGAGCGVVEQVLAGISISERLTELPNCSIRSQCRWYSQRGSNACHVCPLVVTECLEESAGLSK
jgi:hypothetical protein